jgi:hypothetical protein
VECIMNDSFPNGASLSTVVANHEYPRVVIRHGQTAIIFGLRRIALTSPTYKAAVLSGFPGTVLAPGIWLTAYSS